jgi:ABC-type Fe3+ transport system permease subunit
LLAAAWIFVITAGEMTVTNIYFVPTYTEDVYNFYAGNADAKANAVHQLPLLLFTAGLVFCLLAPLPSPALSSSFAPHRWRLGGLNSLLAACGLTLLTALAIFPVANLVERVGEEVIQIDGQLQRQWSLAKGAELLATAPQKYRDEFVSTLALAASVTALATFLAVLSVWWTRQRPHATAMLWLAAIVGIAIPGPVIGLGMIALLNHDIPPLPFLYDRTLAAPILATLVRILPLAFIPTWWALHTLDVGPLDAAALDGASRWQQLWSIVLPQRWPIVAAVALAAFVIASGDVSASLLVLPPGPLETIARRMFGLIHVGADDQVASVALICWGAYWIVASAVTLLLWRSVARPHTV